jgi:hypothetical protein
MPSSRAGLKCFFSTLSNANAPNGSFEISSRGLEAFVIVILVYHKSKPAHYNAAHEFSFFHSCAGGHPRCGRRLKSFDDKVKGDGLGGEKNRPSDQRSESDFAGRAPVLHREQTPTNGFPASGRQTEVGPHEFVPTAQV